MRPVVHLINGLRYAGSGSSYLYGFFDQAWKDNMTRDEAEVTSLYIMSLKIYKKASVTLIWFKFFAHLFGFLIHRSVFFFGAATGG